MSENGKKPRRQFTADLKYQILREARQTGTLVSQVCAKHETPAHTAGAGCQSSAKVALPHFP